MGPTDLHPLEGCERMSTPGRHQWISFTSPLKDARGLVSDNIVLILSGSQETQMSIRQKSITRSRDLLILACLPKFFGMNFVAR